VQNNEFLQKLKQRLKKTDNGTDTSNSEKETGKNTEYHDIGVTNEIVKGAKIAHNELK
jgi:hypothetical protein